MIEYAIKYKYIIIIALAVIALIYLIKHRFRNSTRVRYIDIYKTDTKYLSYDAFWRRKHLKKRIWKFLAFPTLWSFVPIVSNRAKIGGITFIAGGRFGKKYVKIKTARPIKSLNLINPAYHISINAHINFNLDSRRIDKDVEFDGRSANLEYGRNYIILFDDGTGYVLKVRK